MRILVVGAGASIEEAKRAKAPRQFYPPTMIDFAKKLWASPPLMFGHHLISSYLQANGKTTDTDSTKTFLELEKNPDNQINIERLFEYCWNNRDKISKGDWENLMFRGIINPLDFVLAQAFFVNGKGLKILEAGALVVDRLIDGDLILNLNYDTLFEIALMQKECEVTYVPYEYSGKGVLVAKPHGSMNLLADEKQMFFAQPDCFGAAPSGNNKMRNYNSIVPPRHNKEYSQHPIAALIIKSIETYKPTILTFWGVGLTDSDTDLLKLYKNWAVSAKNIEVINPDSKVSNKIEISLAQKTESFLSLDAWLKETKDS